MNEAKNLSTFSGETRTASSFSNEPNPTLISGATFDHATFDNAQFDMPLDSTGSPFTNETKHA